MSGIFGILNPKRESVSLEWLEAIGRGMDLADCQSKSVWRTDNVGFGCMHSRGGEPLLTEHSATGIVLLSQARIDNREELIRRLGLKTGIPVSGGQSTYPDKDLILHAYLRWGEDCVHYLLGDWTLAVWDPRRRKLFIAREPWGIGSLYYYQDARFFVFASSIKGLLALPDVPKRPNLLRVAQVLTAWPGDGAHTAYEGIKQLPSGHTLTVTARHVESHCYWHPEDAPSLQLGSDDEYVDALLELYTEAVRCRLRAPVLAAGGGAKNSRIGATLSSGLDSGSICALAAKALRTRGERLPAFTSVPMYPTDGLAGPKWYGDETALAEASRLFIGSVDVHYVRAENISPMESIALGLRLHDSPMTAGGNQFWIYAVLEAAQREGVGVLLIGQKGNGTVSYAGGPESFWPLLLTGRWRMVWRKAKQSPSPWKAIRTHVLRPVAQPFRNEAIRLRHLARAPWQDYAAISPRLARELDLRRRMKASGHDPFFLPVANPARAHRHYFHYGAHASGPFWAEAGAEYGIEIRDPTMDKRLAEFCLAIPEDQYRLDGQDRALIRRAMAGLLPDAVRLNTRRGRQAADLGHRLLAELPQVQGLMARLEASELACRVLDLPKMRSVLAALMKEVNRATTTQCVTILTRGLLTGTFLLRFECGGELREGRTGQDRSERIWKAWASNEDAP